MERPHQAWSRYDLADDCFLLLAQLPATLRLDSHAFRDLWQAQPEQHGRIVLRGKETNVPRKQQAYERSYWFAGMLHEPAPRHPTPEYALRLQAWLQSLGDTSPFREYHFEPNEVLINWYANGHDYIGSHSDDERQLQLTDRGECLVVTTSHGATRKFRFRRKSDNRIVRDFELADNTVCVMAGLTQRTLKHEIVKVAGKRGLAVGPRVSITIRHFK